MDSHLSKSEKKRRAKNTEQLVNELAALPENVINAIPSDPEIIQELLAAKNLKGGTRKRQLKYVTKLLREKQDHDLYEFLEKKRGSLLRQKRDFHNLEHLRNLLIDEFVRQHDDRMQNDPDSLAGDDNDSFFDSEMLREIKEQLPGADLDLLKKTAGQFARTRNRRFSRELFRILNAAFEKKQYAETGDKDNGL